jgi:hypothetical protein
MAEITRSTSSTKELHVQLIDPTAESVCEEYAAYRRGVRSSKAEKNEWTKERVRSEIYATLLSLFLRTAQYPLLRIDITLLRSFSSFRLDLSSKYVILTKEDPQAPGVRCDNGSYFYDAYRNDLELTAKQGRPVAAVPFKSDLDVNCVRKHLADLALIENGLSDEILQSIIAITKSARNPYA